MTDYELIECIKRSDRTAFFLFLRRHWKLLYLVALDRTGDEEKSFEQVCRLFVSIWDQRRRLPKPGSNIDNWFMRIRLDIPGEWTLLKDRRTSYGKTFKTDLERFTERWASPFVLKINSQK